LQRPAHPFAGELVEPHRQREPAFIRPQKRGCPMSRSDAGRLPCSRISRSTRGLEAGTPRPRNSLTILGLP
jgi:hypothetical protein